MTRARAASRAGALLAAFVGLVALLHLLRAGDLPPADHFVSEYAVGEWGWLMRVAFLCWAASLALTALAWHGVVRWALVVAALGAVGCAAWATQTVAGVLPEDVERTNAGRLHDWSTLLVFAGALLAALWSAVVVRRRAFRLAVAGLALALLAVVPVLVALGLDAPGIGQRGFLLVGVAWQALAVRAAPR